MYKEGCGDGAGVLKKSVERAIWRRKVPVQARCTDRSKIILWEMRFSGVTDDFLACPKAIRLLS